jgi:hypothetical protein
MLKKGEEENEKKMVFSYDGFNVGGRANGCQRPGRG